MVLKEAIVNPLLKANWQKSQSLGSKPIGFVISWKPKRKQGAEQNKNKYNKGLPIGLQFNYIEQEEKEREDNGGILKSSLSRKDKWK